MRRLMIVTVLTMLASALLSVFAQDADLPFERTFPAPVAGQYIHEPPALEDLPDGPLGEAILRGWDIFNNTQDYKGIYTYSDMTCASCHLAEGMMPFSAPVWPVATTYPDYRGKNWRINTLEERISDCFAYSMNGVAPEPGSDDMTAIVAYHTWMAQGAPFGEGDIYGRGYGAMSPAVQEPDFDRGAIVYEASCAICHGADGQGLQVAGETVFPPVWGDGSYNWGAGMSRIPTLAAFVYRNMPLGQPGLLSEQEAWDVAQFINSHERPQDPRYTGDVHETRERHANFHSNTLYGTEVNGQVLGDHDNTGAKPFLRPESLRFEPLAD